MDDVKAIAIASDETLLASGSFDKTVKVWDLKTGELLHTLKHVHGITADCHQSQMVQNAG